MLAEARGKPGAEAIRFVVHDLREPLPFPARVFDLVVSGLVLEHLGDLAAFFGEVRRMAHLGGQLFSRYLIAIEVAGTLLLVGLVGAVAIVAHASYGPLDRSTEYLAFAEVRGSAPSTRDSRG